MPPFDDMTDTLRQAMPDLRGRIDANAPLGKYTWFKVGGPAQILFQPADPDDLSYFLRQLDPGIPVTVLGLCSNVIIRDGGVAGVVIRLGGKGFNQVDQTGDHDITVGTGVPDKHLSIKARDFGIGGFHFYFGIPGGIGGALRMNAGANGVETCERVVSVTAYDRQGRQHQLSLDDMGYAYRHSSAAEDLIFVAAQMRGYQAEREAIQAEMDAVQHHRETAQPIREKTGGSTFKNPDPPGTPNQRRAWKLIDAAGCRGLRVGDAMVSEKHCNFLINTDKARAHDIETLGETVRARVLDTSGVDLHWEIKRVGVRIGIEEMDHD